MFLEVFVPDIDIYDKNYKKYRENRVFALIIAENGVFSSPI